MPSTERPPHRRTTIVRTRQEASEPVFTGGGSTLTRRQQGTQVAGSLVVDQRLPSAYTSSRASRERRRQKQLAQAGAGEPQVGCASGQWLARQNTLDNAHQEWRTLFVRSQDEMIATWRRHGLISDGDTTPGPHAALCSITSCARDATRLVVGLLLGDRRKDASVELAIVSRQVDIPLNGRHPSEVNLAASVQQALKVAWLPDEAIHVVGHQGVSFIELLQHALEGGTPALVRGDVVVLIDAYVHLAWLPRTASRHVKAIAYLSCDSDTHGARIV
jgi:hypothetical protein